MDEVIVQVLVLKQDDNAKNLVPFSLSGVSALAIICLQTVQKYAIKTENTFGR